MTRRLARSTHDDTDTVDLPMPGATEHGYWVLCDPPHNNRPYYERNRQPETYQPSPYERKMDEEERQYRIQRNEQERAQERRQQEWEHEREQRQDPRWER